MREQPVFQPAAFLYTPSGKQLKMLHVGQISVSEAGKSHMHNASKIKSKRGRSRNTAAEIALSSPLKDICILE